MAQHVAMIPRSRPAGDPKFLGLATRFAYGDDCSAIASGRVAALQALSGTGSLRVGFELLRRFHGSEAPVLIPNPTWGNHPSIIRVRISFDAACADVQRWARASV